jgi:hypothetical protein
MYAWDRMRNTCRLNQGRIHLGDRAGLRGSMKVILKKWDVKFWTGFTGT